MIQLKGDRPLSSLFETYLGDRQFDESFTRKGHLATFPDMLPWVGSTYAQQHFKLLVVGESHYFSKGTDFHHDPSQWYERPKTCHEELKTREGHRVRFQVSKLIDRKLSSAHKMYSTIAGALNKTTYFKEKSKQHNVFDAIAYVNYFQRPANNANGSISVTPLDSQVAHATLEQIIDTIRPDAVIFVSKKAWASARGSGLLPKIHCLNGQTAHPCSAWWNRAVKRYSIINGEPSNAGPLTGRERFIALVNYYSQAV